jgi:hypothetical protein
MRSGERDQSGKRTTITGTINADGTIAGGTGFTVSHDSTGQYTLHYQGLKALLSVNFSVLGLVGYAAMATGLRPDLSTYKVVNSAAAQVDGACMFVAIGLAA